MTAMRPPSRHVAVVGGGIIGLAIAWAAVGRGHRVTLIDPSPASGATYAAAGMLAPVSELHYREESLLDLTLASAWMYRKFTSDVEDASGLETGYLAAGTLVAGVDAADRQALADLRAAQLELGLEVQELSTREARRMEPMLGPQLTGAFLIPDDHQVDPRAFAAALLAALQAGVRVEIVRTAAVGLLYGNAEDDGVTRDAIRHGTGTCGMDDGDWDDGGMVTGVRLADGSRIDADEVVLANGLGAASMDGLPDGLELPLRPVYGDILRLRAPQQLQPLVTRTVRAVVRGFPVYVVPRSDGTVVIGATQREDGSDALSAGGVYQLLRDAQTVVPAVAELELLEAVCRARPGTPDNAPLLGGCRRTDGADVPGLIVATGFFRHGVLLAPVAAAICADLLDGVTPDVDIEPYRPDRFRHGSTVPGNLSDLQRSQP
ncbi:FAD-dependent oxidoreductase [Arthrobacter sp. H14]|uniref:FAD-dependent oxidoreductase n=1 Tax=Arthrobacter sp. H14 TaxID=1312959 RepID=UPI00047978F4|nr:FAD-dependent oxidoreductase [Arthrobacter sp. H14]